MLCAAASMLASTTLTGTASAAEDQQLTAAPAWTPATVAPIEPGDIASRAATEGVSAAVAEQRFLVERAATELEQQAATRWPDAFAGVWIDRSDFAVRVAFTNDAAQHVADLATTFKYPAYLKAATANASYRALAGLQHRLSDTRAALQRGEVPAGTPAALRATRGVFDLDLDVTTNEVVVHVPDATKDVKTSLANAYGPLVRAVSGVAEPASCSIYDCTYAMLGGIELQVGTTNLCSSAFTAFNGSTRYTLSAAHCYVLTGQTARSNASAYYGYTDLYSYSGPVDAERIRKSSSWRESGKFFVEGENPRYVSYYMPYSGIVVGSYIGKTGRTTGSTQGYVLSKTVSPSYVSGSYNFISADFCVDGGDSGGAVWQSNTAFGIISGKFNNTTCYPAPGRSQGTAGQGIFGSVETAFNTLGVQLIGNLNLAPNASFTYSCSVLLACSFNSSGSDDEDGSITSRSWSFGDGTYGSGTYPSHTYTLPGTYTVQLTVYDNNGAAGYTSQSITVL